MNYKVVVKRISNEDLVHSGTGKERENHKYVKRESLGNGKYRYYYEEDTANLFSSSSKMTSLHDGDEHVIEKRGKIDRAADKLFGKKKEAYEFPEDTITIKVADKSKKQTNKTNVTDNIKSKMANAKNTIEKAKSTALNKIENSEEKISTGARIIGFLVDKKKKR